MTTAIDFETHKYQPFQLQFTPMLTLWLTLAVVQKPTDSTCEERTSEEPHELALIFQGPRRPVLPTQKYQLAHSILGNFDLMLTPYAWQASSIQYQALFSLHSDSAPLEAV